MRRRNEPWDGGGGVREADGHEGGRLLRGAEGRGERVSFQLGERPSRAAEGGKGVQWGARARRIRHLTSCYGNLGRGLIPLLLRPAGRTD